MPQLVSPKVFLVGYTTADMGGITDYLRYTKQEDFLASWQAAMDVGIQPGEALCSLFAKLCYKSLVLGKNANVKRVRDVQANIESCHDTGHGSVFEGCGINFIVTGCSRVLTHELVRHRVGTAFSQTSGRYCRLDEINLVWDSILDPVKDLFLGCVRTVEDTVYLAECKLGLRRPNPNWPDVPAEEYVRQREAIRLVGASRLDAEDVRWVPDDSFDFERRKKITSAIRRIAPNGQENEIAFSVNVRALRHIVQLRTARFAEREIRDVFNQIYGQVRGKFPTVFYRARTRLVDDLLEVYGMRQLPYEITLDDPKALQLWDTPALQAELDRRAQGPAA
jgi:thymidylate synthase (FAD)